jgi:NAD-dependent SIR2 family protein deacetylase
MATQGYCVKCKNKVDIQNPVESKTKKGTKIAKGKCPDCGTTVCRMGGITK